MSSKIDKAFKFNTDHAEQLKCYNNSFFKIISKKSISIPWKQSAKSQTKSQVDGLSFFSNISLHANYCVSKMSCKTNKTHQFVPSHDCCTQKGVTRASLKKNPHTKLMHSSITDAKIKVKRNFLIDTSTHKSIVFQNYYVSPCQIKPVQTSPNTHTQTCMHEHMCRHIRQHTDSWINDKFNGLENLLDRWLELCKMPAGQELIDTVQ